MQRLEPPSNVRPRLNRVTSNRREQRAVRKVEQVSESDFVSSEVGLLREDLVVNVELGLKFLDQGIENGDVGSLPSVSVMTMTVVISLQ